MPGMPRPEGRGKKIAYKILGVPANMKELRKSKREKEIDKILRYDDTQRSR